MCGVTPSPKNGGRRDYMFVRRLAGGNDAGDNGGDPPHVRRRAGRHVPLPCRPLAYAVGAVT